MLKKVVGDRVNPIPLETVEQTLENALECPDSTNQDETLIKENKRPRRKQRRAVSFYVFGNIGRVMAYKTAKNLLNN